MRIHFDHHLSSDSLQKRRVVLFEEKTKSIYEGKTPETQLVYFKDRHPLFDEDGWEIPGKGILNNRMSGKIFSHLNYLGIPTYYLEQYNMREQVVYAVDPLPFYVEVHNYACGDFAHRFLSEENTPLRNSLIELRFKNQAAEDPVVSPAHLMTFDFCSEDDIDGIVQYTQRINDFLQGQFLAHQTALMRYKLQFGFINFFDDTFERRLVLIDEISFDTCYLLDLETKKRIDPLFDDVFETVQNQYMDCAKRFGLLKPSEGELRHTDLEENLVLFKNYQNNKARI